MFPIFFPFDWKYVYTYMQLHVGWNEKRKTPKIQYDHKWNDKQTKKKYAYSWMQILCRSFFFLLFICCSVDSTRSPKGRMVHGKKSVGKNFTPNWQHCIRITFIRFDQHFVPKCNYLCSPASARYISNDIIACFDGAYTFFAPSLSLSLFVFSLSLLGCMERTVWAMLAHSGKMPSWYIEIKLTSTECAYSVWRQLINRLDLVYVARDLFRICNIEI